WREQKKRASEAGSYRSLSFLVFQLISLTIVNGSSSMLLVLEIIRQWLVKPTCQKAWFNWFSGAEPISLLG
ncbi:MAG: hypothetical protein KDC92_13175, partial [Bacteroidetes bacterium]|nr:hypothetical protein [Bacteroidota bacterium]